MNLKSINIKQVLFLDIETRNLFKNLTFDNPYYESWHYNNKKECETEQDCLDLYEQKGALFPEFSAICCISIGAETEEGEFKTASFYGENEKEVLEKFFKAFELYFTTRGFKYVCTHAGNWFDLPFIGRRAIVNGLDIPDKLNCIGLPPWKREHHLDTKDLWGMGGAQASLIAVSIALGLPSPKQGLQGSEVNKAFWEGRMDEIVDYCENGDVPAVYNIFRRMQGVPVDKQYNNLKEVLLDIEKDKVITKQQKKILTSNKLDEKGKQTLTKLLKAVYIDDDMFSTNQDNAQTKREKIAEIKDLIDSIK